MSIFKKQKPLFKAVKIAKGLYVYRGCRISKGDSHPGYYGAWDFTYKGIYAKTSRVSNLKHSDDSKTNAMLYIDAEAEKNPQWYTDETHAEMVKNETEDFAEYGII